MMVMVMVMLMLINMIKRIVGASGFVIANEVKYARMELSWRVNHTAILHAIPYNHI
jgi:hypothetical protein